MTTDRQTYHYPQVSSTQIKPFFKISGTRTCLHQSQRRQFQTIDVMGLDAKTLFLGRMQSSGLMVFSCSHNGTVSRMMVVFCDFAVVLPWFQWDWLVCYHDCRFFVVSDSSSEAMKVIVHARGGQQVVMSREVLFEGLQDEVRLEQGWMSCSWPELWFQKFSQVCALQHMIQASRLLTVPNSSWNFNSLRLRKVLITHNLRIGVLDIPPPILSRYLDSLC